MKNINKDFKKGDPAYIYVRNRGVKKTAIYMGSKQETRGLFNKETMNMHRFLYDYSHKTYECYIGDKDIIKWIESAE